MPTTSQIAALNDFRMAALKKASEDRNVDALMSWHAKDATFTDMFNNITHTGIDAIRAFYAPVYAAMPVARITEAIINGSETFAAAEMRYESEAGMDLPQMGLKKGETMALRGVSLFEWRWEGEGEWDESLDEKARGWKIVRERAYYRPV